VITWEQPQHDEQLQYWAVGDIIRPAVGASIGVSVP
jgi:hypothetical protein